MTIKKTDIKRLPKDTQLDLLFLLYRIEDELGYECRSISETINYLQGGEQNA